VGADDPVTDRHAHLRLDVHDRAIEKHESILTKALDEFSELKLNSATNHATTQAQNAQILARLNQPSVVMSVIGNPTTVAGVVSLIGALVAGAVALGYAGAPVRDVPVLVPTVIAQPVPSDATTP
jgi:hypothetical protein